MEKYPRLDLKLLLSTKGHNSNIFSYYLNSILPMMKLTVLMDRKTHGAMKKNLQKETKPNILDSNQQMRHQLNIVDNTVQILENDRLSIFISIIITNINLFFYLISKHLDHRIFDQGDLTFSYVSFL